MGKHGAVDNDVRIDVQQHPDAELVQVLVRRLVASNDRVAPPENHERLAVFASADGELVGGASEFTHWAWLFVSHFWVDETRRHRGLGSELMDKIERAGALRGAQAVHLDTYDFQALAFYEARGYPSSASWTTTRRGTRAYVLTRNLGNERNG